MAAWNGRNHEITYYYRPGHWPIKFPRDRYNYWQQETFHAGDTLGEVIAWLERRGIQWDRVANLSWIQSREYENCQTITRAEWLAERETMLADMAAIIESGVQL
jgi:hypothetical protein